MESKETVLDDSIFSIDSVSSHSEDDSTSHFQSDTPQPPPATADQSRDTDNCSFTEEDDSTSQFQSDTPQPPPATADQSRDTDNCSFTEEMPLSCDVCSIPPALFFTKRVLAEHITRKHQLCQVLRRVWKAKVEMNLSCDVCATDFPSNRKPNLLVHWRARHQENKNRTKLASFICDDTSFRGRQLRRKYSSKQALTQALFPRMICTREEKHNWTCDICSKQLYSRLGLTIHVSSHL